MTNTNPFFEKPILNSPYAEPGLHWELDSEGQPTGRVMDKRRPCALVTPMPMARGQKQQELLLGDAEFSTQDQQYSPYSVINRIRDQVNRWRTLPNPKDWRVTPVTERLLKHWRYHHFMNKRPFFCQIEAAETVIWLVEVARVFGSAKPVTKEAQDLRRHFEGANRQANPELMRMALKLATGAGKTTVMAMLIAWSVLNTTGRPNSRRFTKNILIVTPGITVRDRLRVLYPNDEENLYREAEIVPQDMRGRMQYARIVITNYHAFIRRERDKIPKQARALLHGDGLRPDTCETEGEMLRRALEDLKGEQNILILNDEGHHCYREKPSHGLDPGANDEPAAPRSKDNKAEADKNNETARVWISGLEAIKRRAGAGGLPVIDLSATPFFLAGSGYVEGTLFPWTVSDFSLMDAIESGIVKLPRVPISDNSTLHDVPIFRELWDHIGKDMPKKRGEKAQPLDPKSLPAKLLTALDALYSHYERTFEAWERAESDVPPVFIIVCNNTLSSRVVYDYIAGGFTRKHPGGLESVDPGHFELFHNYDENGERLARPRTLLIDSEQLESDDALSKDFRDTMAPQIEQFKREIAQRSGVQASNLTDQELLREAMNTVGQPGRLGAEIRCVVSVSMLTEGWDARNVTHIMGVRAFGTQLLCEQVVGRALRRQCYEPGEDGLFPVEYADILGVPFNFAKEPQIVKPPEVRRVLRVQAVKPERDRLEIIFPRIVSYFTRLPEGRIDAHFTQDAKLVLTPELVGAGQTVTRGIVGEEADLKPENLRNQLPSTILYLLTPHILGRQFRDADNMIQNAYFVRLKSIVRHWMREYLICEPGTFPAQLLFHEIADMAGERIKAAVTIATEEQEPGARAVTALPDPYNPTGSTSQVNFTTTKEIRWRTAPDKSHINWAVCDSAWERAFCRIVEEHPRVIAYVKNAGLGFEIPYRSASLSRRYVPDLILRVDTGGEDLLNLVIEIKGYRGEDAKDKANTMRSYWLPGVNRLGRYGRWAFAEIREITSAERMFALLIERIIAAPGPDSLFFYDDA